MILLLDWTTTRYHDLLAQLGEHYLDRVGVSGSSPLQIIRKSPCVARAFLFSYVLIEGRNNGFGDELGTEFHLRKPEGSNLFNFPATRVFTFLVTCTYVSDVVESLA